MPLAAEIVSESTTRPCAIEGPERKRGEIQLNIAEKEEEGE
jgi:hypothetical protein